MRAGGERVCDGVFALHDSGVGGQDVRGKLNVFRSELYFASFLPLDNLHRIITQKKIRGQVVSSFSAYGQCLNP